MITTAGHRSASNRSPNRENSSSAMLAAAMVTAPLIHSAASDAFHSLSRCRLAEHAASWIFH